MVDFNVDPDGESNTLGINKMDISADLDEYLKIKEDAYPGVNFSGLKKPLNSEMKRLIFGPRMRA